MIPFQTFVSSAKDNEEKNRLYEENVHHRFYRRQQTKVFYQQNKTPLNARMITLIKIKKEKIITMLVFTVENKIQSYRKKSDNETK